VRLKVDIESVFTRPSRTATRRARISSSHSASTSGSVGPASRSRMIRARASRWLWGNSSTSRVIASSVLGMAGQFLVLVGHGFGWSAEAFKPKERVLDVCAVGGVILPHRFANEKAVVLGNPCCFAIRENAVHKATSDAFVAGFQNEGTRPCSLTSLVSGCAVSRLRRLQPGYIT